jgi:hypothetical protein
MVTVITAVVITATNIKLVAAATVASAAAIVATFLLQLIVDCCFAPPSESMILSAPPAESMILSLHAESMILCVCLVSG